MDIQKQIEYKVTVNIRMLILAVTRLFYDSLFPSSGSHCRLIQWPISHLVDVRKNKARKETGTVVILFGESARRATVAQLNLELHKVTRSFNAIFSCLVELRDCASLREMLSEYIVNCICTADYHCPIVVIHLFLSFVCPERKSYRYSRVVISPSLTLILFVLKKYRSLFSEKFRYSQSSQPNPLSFFCAACVFVKDVHILIGTY